MFHGMEFVCKYSKINSIHLRFALLGTGLLRDFHGETHTGFSLDKDIQT